MTTEPRFEIINRDGGYTRPYVIRQAGPAGINNMVIGRNGKVRSFKTAARAEAVIADLHRNPDSVLTEPHAEGYFG